MYFFLIFIFKFFSLFFPTYKKVAELSVGFFFFLMVKSLVCFFFVLEAFISRTCLSHSETSGGPRVSVLLSLSHSLTQFPLPWAKRERGSLESGWVRKSSQVRRSPPLLGLGVELGDPFSWPSPGRGVGPSYPSSS